MKRTRRTLAALVLLSVFAVAVPASAASWRTYATVRSEAGYHTFASATAKDMQDFQIGIYTYGSSRTLDWEASYFCERGNNSSGKSRSGTVTTRARTWKWVTVRNGTANQDLCNMDVGIIPTSFAGSHRLKIRVK